MTPHEAIEVLGLAGRLDERTVKAAYRRLARDHHPDRGGDADRFQRIQVAYEVLTAHLPQLRGEQRAPQERVASVDQRWWEASSRWHDGLVDTSGVDWDREVPAQGSFRVDRDRLAVLLAAGEPVGEVTLHSRSPGSFAHRFIDWLQTDLLAEIRIAPATERGIRDHDVVVAFEFRSVKARRVVGDAELPGGWTRRRRTSSLTVERVVHPSRDRRETAVRLTRLVDGLLEAVGWPLEDWFVVRS